MPGFIPHFLTGNLIFLSSYIVLSYLPTYQQSKKDTLFLYGLCIICSIIPDFPLGLYYLFHISTFNTLLDYHSFLHKIISPTVVIIFILFSVFNIIKKKYIWIIGIICIIIHILLDATIEEMGVWI
jgi:hypothetical protein